MSWSEIDGTGKTTQEKELQAKERLAQDIEIAKKFNRLFGSEDGTVVYQYLFNKFILENETPLTATNVEYEAGYHAGESGVIKFIAHQITKATRL